MTKISFNSLSMKSEFLKNKSDPSQPLSHIGKVSTIRTKNYNGPNMANGFKRAGYPTANNAISRHTRIGRNSKRAMAIRNETRRVNRLGENIKLKGISYYNNDGMPRSIPRNNEESHSNGILLHKQLNEAMLRNAEAEVQRARNALAANRNGNSDEHLKLKDNYASAKAKLNSLKVGGSKRKTKKYMK